MHHSMQAQNFINIAGTQGLKVSGYLSYNRRKKYIKALNIIFPVSTWWPYDNCQTLICRCVQNLAVKGHKARYALDRLPVCRRATIHAHIHS